MIKDNYRLSRSAFNGSAEWTVLRTGRGIEWKGEEFRLPPLKKSNKFDVDRILV